MWTLTGFKAFCSTTKFLRLPQVFESLNFFINLHRLSAYMEQLEIQPKDSVSNVGRHFQEDQDLADFDDDPLPVSDNKIYFDLQISLLTSVFSHTVYIIMK